MANPVRKHTKCRQGNRRAHWNITLPATSPDKESALESPRTLRHFMSSDGYYRGRKIQDVKPKTKEEN